MHFSFVDRVLQLEPGVRITTVKCLSMAEEYLADHFPRFRVMPGVLMLQAMTQAASVLISASEDYAHSIVTLKEARNVRYADFVQPGDVLTVTAELLKIEPRDAHFKAQGTLNGRLAVSGRLVLERYNLVDSSPDLAANDAFLKRHLKEQLALVYQPSTSAAPQAVNGTVPVAAPLAPAPESTRGEV